MKTRNQLARWSNSSEMAARSPDPKHCMHERLRYDKHSELRVKRLGTHLVRALGLLAKVAEM